MEPRFFSIAYHNKEERFVTIMQSVFFYPHDQIGTCSLWLRNIQPGEVVQAKTSVGALGLPLTDESTIIMIGAGTGLAPFRSYWTGDGCAKHNRFVLFFGA